MEEFVVAKGTRKAILLELYQEFQIQKLCRHDNFRLLRYLLVFTDFAL